MPHVHEQHMLSRETQEWLMFVEHMTIEQSLHALIVNLPMNYEVYTFGMHKYVRNFFVGEHGNRVLTNSLLH